MASRTIKIYADLSGRITGSSSTSWDDARENDTTGPTANTDDTRISVGGRNVVTTFYQAYSGSLRFHMDHVPSTALITNIDLKITNWSSAPNRNGTMRARIGDYGEGWLPDNYTGWIAASTLAATQLLGEADYSTSDGASTEYTFSKNKASLSDWLDQIDSNNRLLIALSSAELESASVPTWSDISHQMDGTTAYLEVTYDENPQNDIGYVLDASATSGDIQSSSSTWANAQAGTNLVTSGSSGHGYYLSGSTHVIEEAFIQFDLSTLQDRNIESATLLIPLTHGTQPLGSHPSIMEIVLHDWGTSLTTGDWLNDTEWASKPLLASMGWSSIPIEDGLTTGIRSVQEYSLSSEAVAYIRDQSNSRMGLVFTMDTLKESSAPDSTYEWFQGFLPSETRLLLKYDRSMMGGAVF